MRRSRGLSFAVLVFLPLTTARAQEFFNGQRGPAAIQIDTHLIRSSGETKGFIAAKIFTRNATTWDGDYLLALPFDLSRSDRLTPVGVNAGHVSDFGAVSMIHALSITKNGAGRFATLSPQSYLTGVNGRWSADAEASASFDTESGGRGAFGAVTLGYGLTDWLRYGASVVKPETRTAVGELLLRVDPFDDHRLWLDIHIEPDAVDFRLVANF